MNIDVKGKIEFTNSPAFINSPNGRYDAWLKRDDKVYCKFHQRIHPDNVESIKLQHGSTVKKTKKEIEVKHFRYCPRCFVTSTV